MACNNRLTSNTNDGCNSDSIKGIEQKAWIYSWDDIDHSLKNLDYLASFLIQSNTGYPIYLYGEKPFEGTKRELEKGKYNNTFMEVAAFALLADNPDNAAAVQAMSKGRWVMMFEKTSGAGWTIFGLEQGLKAETKVCDIYGEAAWEVTLASKGNYFSSMFLASAYPAAPWASKVTPEVLLTEYVMLPINVVTEGVFVISVMFGTPEVADCREIIFERDGGNTVDKGHGIAYTPPGLGVGPNKAYLDKATTHLSLNKATASNIGGAVDLSALENLVEVYAAFNSITSIDVSKNVLLTILDVGVNEITAIDISKNVLLTVISVAGNQIQTIDASKNTSLVIFRVEDNLLTTTALKNTIVGLVQGKAAAVKTQMTTVYVAGNPNVSQLWDENWTAIGGSFDSSNSELATYLLTKKITLIYE